MWRIEKLEQIVNGGKHVGLEPDGRLYTIDLMDKWGHHALKEGEQLGQLRVKHYRQPGGDKYENTDWWFEIEAVDGGLVNVDDAYMNLAPESGYESGPIIIQQRASSLSYKTRFDNQRIYFVSNNKKYYGVLEFSIATRGNEVASLRYKYKLNLNSSRNLELKPNKNYSIQ